MNNSFQEIFDVLYDHFGPQYWWPGETPFEITVGAILTQNTNWSNVEKAINVLKDRGVLAYEALSHLSVEILAPLIRSSGYYNLKARRLRNFFNMIEVEYGGDYDEFLGDSLEAARSHLLSVKGIGPETADSILLYACEQPIFVIDMYTHRVFSRHNLVDEETDYETMQSLFMANLPHRQQLFNEYHALIVRVAATYCKKTKPLCGRCPLQGYNL